MSGHEADRGAGLLDEGEYHVRKGWTATISIDEYEGQTRAKARLRWRDQEAVGVGVSRLAPTDRFNSQIGDELAVARALSDLARRMMAGTVQHTDAEEEQLSYRRIGQPHSENLELTGQ